MLGWAGNDLECILAAQICYVNRRTILFAFLIKYFIFLSYEEFQWIVRLVKKASKLLHFDYQAPHFIKT